MSTKMLEKAFNKYANDRMIGPLAEAYSKLTGMESQSSEKNLEIDKIKIRIFTATMNRVNLLEKKKRNLTLIIGAQVLSLSVLGFVFNQSFVISNKMLLAKTEILQLLSDNLDEQYQTSFEKMQNKMEANLDSDFKKLNQSLSIKLDKEMKIERKILSKRINSNLSNLSKQ